VVNALNAQNVRQVRLPAISSAAEAQAQLGDDTRVVAAFQTVMSRILRDLDTPIESEALVAGNDADAKRQVMLLAEAIGMRAWDIGPIENAAAAETMAAVVMHLGAQHNSKIAGLRVTGISTRISWLWPVVWAVRNSPMAWRRLSIHEFTRIIMNQFVRIRGD